jgi:hypothetical protein
MIRAGLCPLAIPGQLTRRDAQPIRQAGHRLLRRRADFIRHEPQPRQPTQLHTRTQHIALTREFAQEPLVRAGQGEVPDQLRAGDLRETPQPGQLLLGEHIPRAHNHRPVIRHHANDGTLDPPTQSAEPARRPAQTLQIVCFFSGSYGEAQTARRSLAPILGHSLLDQTSAACRAGPFSTYHWQIRSARSVAAAFQYSEKARWPCAALFRTLS